MALVTYVLGDCPACKRKSSFGNIDVRGSFVSCGCKSCQYKERIPLPKIKKKILYLDQFFFSHAFRGGDARFIEAAEKISELAALQLLVVPYSSIHEDETHQWKGSDELLKFIKSTSRGHEFAPAYDVESRQILKGFRAWLAGDPVEYQMEERDALKSDIHDWDGYFWIDVGRYVGDIDLIRGLKSQTIEDLVEAFDDWRKLTTAFQEDLDLEYRDGARGYIDSYFNFAVRISNGDYDALLDSPINSKIIQNMLRALPEETPQEDSLKKCSEFLISDHFKQLPYQLLSCLMLATLKAMVKNGAYTNKTKAIKRLSGFFYDVNHIATYAPYSDAFVMDQPMADIVKKPSVSLEATFGTKVFSLNNWDEFLDWLDSLKEKMDEDHKVGLIEAYPYLSA